MALAAVAVASAGLAVIILGVMRPGGPPNAPRARAPLPGVQPGVSSAVVHANQVIVFGVGEGIWIYNGTPAAGNPPVLSMSTTSADPFGNATVNGIASYAGAGTGGAYGQLVNGALNLVPAGGLPAGAAAGQVAMQGSGYLAAQSGTNGSGDTPAIIAALSASAAGGTSAIELTAGQVVLQGGTIPQPPPSATASAIITALTAAGIFT